MGSGESPPGVCGDSGGGCVSAEGKSSRSAHEADLRDLSDWRAIEGMLSSAMTECSYPDAAAFAVKLAMEEAIVNGFKHGNKGDESLKVHVEWVVKPNEVTLSVEDEGPGFKPDSVPDPRDPALLEVPGGRGLLLMKAYMHDVSHNDRGNRVTMVYRKSKR
jgi:serine/threonine-protein kinase RsbW